MEAQTFPGFRKRSVHVILPPHVQALCRARGIKRWSALLTQTKSRIGSTMRKRLGEANWKAFVRYSKVRHKERFLRALTPPSGRLCCGGKIDGTPCPNGAHLDLATAPYADLATLLPTFHMDHTYDVSHICDVWSRALPPNPSSWDDGVCGPLVAHLLFGTEDNSLAESSPCPLWRKQVTVRCGNSKASKEKAEDYCHDTSNAHYGHVLNVSDIRLA